MLFSPRYDLPLYLSPSCRDLGLPQRILLGFRLLTLRFFVRLRGKPDFVMDTKPSCLGGRFERDSDAIHWVSQHDIILYARQRQLQLAGLDTRHQVSRLSKQWLIDRFCKLSICLRKPESIFPRGD
jgi:hypothetical protein